MGERREVSTSSAKSFWRCRRLYFLRNVQRLEPKHTPTVLWTGRLYHECLERLYRDKQVLFSDMLREWEQKRLAELEDAASREDVDADPDKLHTEVELVDGVMKRYVEKYAAKDFEEWEVIDVERKFRLPLYVPCSECHGAGVEGGWTIEFGVDSLASDTPCKKCKGTGISRQSGYWDWSGRLDLVARRKSDGKIYVWEHKTTTIRDPDVYQMSLHLDPQPRGYVWAARQIYGECHGMVYNIIRKKLPTVPRTTQCKRCKGDGLAREKTKGGASRKTNSPCPYCQGTGIGGLSRAKDIDTTADVFRHALAEHKHIDPDEYEETLAALTARGDTFMYRFIHAVTDQDVKAWIADAYDLCREVRHAELTGRWPRNLGACDDRGRRCAFHHLCLEGTPGAMDFYRQRGTEIPEFEDEENGKTYTVEF